MRPIISCCVLFPLLCTASASANPGEPGSGRTELQKLASEIGPLREEVNAFLKNAVLKKPSVPPEVVAHVKAALHQDALYQQTKDPLAIERRDLASAKAMEGLYDWLETSVSKLPDQYKSAEVLAGKVENAAQRCSTAAEKREREQQLRKGQKTALMGQLNDTMASANIGAATDVEKISLDAATRSRLREMKRLIEGVTFFEEAARRDIAILRKQATTLNATRTSLLAAVESAGDDAALARLHQAQISQWAQARLFNKTSEDMVADALALQKELKRGGGKIEIVGFDQILTGGAEPAGPDIGPVSTQHDDQQLVREVLRLKAEWDRPSGERSDE